MLNKIHVYKAIVVSSLLNVIYTFYISSDAFQNQLAISGMHVGKLEAFMIMENQIDGFWLHTFNGWLSGFGIALFSCLLLLIWIRKI